MTIFWKMFFAAGLLILPLAALGQDKASGSQGSDEAKVISGISIVGNNEAPKSLYIVPWKSSEVGVESSLASSLLNDQMKPVDKEVFVRELDFYELTQSD